MMMVKLFVLWMYFSQVLAKLLAGSQSEERLDLLKERMKEMDISEHELWWYIDSRKFGTVPHSGYGLGFERLILFVTGMGNIRDVIPFQELQKMQIFKFYVKAVSTTKISSETFASAD